MRPAARTLAFAAAPALALAVAGCGSSGSSSHTAAPVAATSAPAAGAPAAAPALSCADISTDLGTVLSDLKSSDAQEQEAWVTNGHSGDLQALISDTNGITGSTQLDQDAGTFNSDASVYLSDQSPYLSPGVGDRVSHGAARHQCTGRRLRDEAGPRSPRHELIRHGLNW